MSHLHNGDSARVGIALGVSVITLVISTIAALIANIIATISNIFGQNKEVGAFAELIGFSFVLFMWIFLIFVKCGNWVVDLAMLLQGRRQEYKADKFAIKAGFGDGLLSFLEKQKIFT
jgi:hypothetical protein